MMPAQFRIDLFDEIEALVGRFEPLVLHPVIRELEGLSQEGGTTGSAARLGLALCRKCTVAECGEERRGSVDEQVIEYAARNNCIVVTNDRHIRDSLIARGIGVISLRKQKKLELWR